MYFSDISNIYKASRIEAIPDNRDFSREDCNSGTSSKKFQCPLNKYM